MFFHRSAGHQYLGCTIIGELVGDVSRGIDTPEKLSMPEINLNQIMIPGNSGGGTSAFYSVCCEEIICCDRKDL